MIDKRKADGLVSPACAGMIRSRPVDKLRAAGEPRMRGDDPVIYGTWSEVWM